MRETSSIPRKAEQALGSTPASTAEWSRGQTSREAPPRHEAFHLLEHSPLQAHLGSESPNFTAVKGNRRKTTSLSSPLPRRQSCHRLCDVEQPPRHIDYVTRGSSHGGNKGISLCSLLLLPRQYLLLSTLPTHIYYKLSPVDLAVVEIAKQPTAANLRNYLLRRIRQATTMAQITSTDALRNIRHRQGLTIQ